MESENAPNPSEAFEGWLLRRVAQAVEAGEVSGDLLTELRAEIAEAHERPSEEGQAVAIQELAERWGLPVVRVEELLGELEAQPSMTQELYLRRIVEAWLEEQRKAYRKPGVG